MIRTSIALTLALLVVPACKKKEDAGAAATKTAETTKAADKAPEKPAAVEPAAAAPEAAGKPIEMDAPALFTDFNKPGQDPMALLDKWKPGTVVTGTVTNTVTEESGTMSVWLDAGEKHQMSLGFTDSGKAAKDKSVKKGDKVTAQCQIGGSDDHLMMLTDCTLK